MPDIGTLPDIAEYQTDAENSFRLLFSQINLGYFLRFSTYLPREVDAELAARIDETDLRSSLMTLALVEAAFRVDYLERCKLKKTDNVSIAFRKIFKVKKERARLDDDILKTWYDNIVPADRRAITELRKMFKFRHWLAHGRYWNYSSNYNFQDVYLIANAVMDELQLYS